MLICFSNIQPGCKTADACLVPTVSDANGRSYSKMYLVTEDDLKIKITLPSVHLITGIWWQAEYRPSYDSYIAYITRVTKVKYNVPSGLGVSDSTGQKNSWLAVAFDRYPWDDTYSGKWRKAGKELRREIAHLPKPLYTDEIIMSKFEISAEPGPGNDHIKSKLGFDIKVQFELFGCSNYDLDRSKQ